MANNELFIDIATLLWAVNIAAAKDKTGNPIVPDTLEAVSGTLAM